MVTTTTTAAPDVCEDITKHEVDYVDDDGVRVVVKEEFWKCTNANASGSQCKLQCAKQGLQLQNKQDSKGDHKRQCQCTESGCSWSGNDVVCIDRPVSSTTALPLTTTPSSSTSSVTPDDSTDDKTCGSESLTDINGVWFCNEDTIQNGSICKLKCRAGFFGSHAYMKRKCTCKDATCSWTRKQIKCLTQPPPTQPTTTDATRRCSALNDDNGYWKCSNEMNKGSKCNLMCFAGYEQLRTKKRCRCKGDKCNWKGKDRQCVKTGSFSTVAPGFDQTCPVELNDENGAWECTAGNAINSKCTLKCHPGNRVNAFGNKRRCRCSAKREQCSWTRHQIMCVPNESDLDLWGETAIPESLQTERCPALITDEGKYERVVTEGDIVDNGQWVCYDQQKAKLTLDEHNKLGARCHLKCNAGFAVIADGEQRRCRLVLVV